MVRGNQTKNTIFHSHSDHSNCHSESDARRISSLLLSRLSLVVKQLATLILLVLVVAIFACCFFVGQHAEAQSEFVGEIHITANGEGYTYTDSTHQGSATTLQGVIDALCENKTSTDVLNLTFDSIRTDESLVLKGCNYVLNGELIDTATGREMPLLTVNKNVSLTWRGLNVNASFTAVKVEVGAQMTMTSGWIRVNHTGVYNCYAIIASGRVLINGGTVECNSTVSSGAALLTNTNSSNVYIGGESYIRLSGNSSVVIGYGIATIDSGIFEATHPTYQTETMEGNTSSGFALNLSSDANVVINGGSFSSVTPNNTVYVGGKSQLTYNGGSVSGQVRLADDSEVGASIIIDSKKIITSNGVGAFLSASEGEILLKDNAILASYSGSGRRFLYWSTSEGEIHEQSVLVSDLPQGNIGMVSTNVYGVSFTLGSDVTNREYEYGETVDILEVISEFPLGFVVDSWTVNGNPIEGTSFIVTGKTVVKGTLSLLKPELQEIADINKVYDADPFYLKAIASHDVATLSYQWERFDENSNSFVACGNTYILELLSVKDSGVYRCTVNAEFDGYTSSVTTRNINVVCSKAQYADSDIPAVSLSGVYSRNKSLKDYDLPSGFIWQEDSIVPVVNTTEYQAIYCMDNENYFEKTVSIPLLLDKGDLSKDYETIYPYNSFDGVYNPSAHLSDFTLNENYYWVDSTILPTCAQRTYRIYFNPDSDNYYNYDMTVVINLSKANYTNIENVSVTLSYVSDLDLYDLIEFLPYGYSFAERYPTMTKLTVGISEHQLIYNLDSANYNDYVDSRLIATIEKGTPVYYGGVSFIKSYTPNITLADIVFENADSLRWVDNTISPEIGEHIYKAVYNPDAELYNDILVDISVNLTKGIPSDVDYNYSIDIYYRENLRLSDISLKDGYRWVEPSTKIYAGLDQHFEAVYNPNGENYDDIALTITVNVNKGIISMDGFVFDDLTVVYDGNKHSIVYSGELPSTVEFVEYQNNEQLNSGTYYVNCILKQTDLDNYEPIQLKYSAVLTINKATSIIIGETTQVFVHDGKAKKAVVELNNKQQVLSSDIENKFVKVGSYRIVFSVKETDNYTAAELAVNVVINRSTVTVDESSVSISLINEENGFSNDVALSLNVVEETDNRLVIEYSLTGNCPQGSKLSLSLPAKFDTSKLDKLLDGSGNELLYEIDSDTYNIVFDAIGTGKIELTFNDKSGNSYTWMISLGVIAVVMIIGVIAFTIVSERRKKHVKK